MRAYLAYEPAVSPCCSGRIVLYALGICCAERRDQLLTRGGETIVQSEPCSYTCVSYVPRQSGTCELSVFKAKKLNGYPAPLPWRIPLNAGGRLHLSRFAQTALNTGWMYPMLPNAECG